jgi:hypothetical protein
MYAARDHENRIDVPDEFRFVAEEFWEVGGKIVAVLGPVVQEGHPFHGFQLCALPLPYPDIDFDENQGNYTLVITPERARLSKSHSPPHPDSVVGSGYPEYRGCAQAIQPGRAIE